eukprot:6076159-Karenia_brevis.AAC.1
MVIHSGSLPVRKRGDPLGGHIRNKKPIPRIPSWMKGKFSKGKGKGKPPDEHKGAHKSKGKGRRAASAEHGT